MNTRRLLCGTVLVGSVVLIGGCGRAVVSTDNPAAVPAEDYDAVFDQSVRTLRAMRFTVDRQDRRFGVVTSRPLVASSLFEPWYADNTTGGQVTESTLNCQRRRVRITLKPAHATGEAGEAETVPSDTYLFRVEVTVERRQMPPRQLTSAAVSQLQFGRGVHNAHSALTEGGREEAYWRPIGRDAHLEQRLIAEILHRAGSPPPAVADARTPR